MDILRSSANTLLSEAEKVFGDSTNLSLRKAKALLLRYLNKSDGIPVPNERGVIEIDGKRRILPSLKRETKSSSVHFLDDGSIVAAIFRLGQRPIEIRERGEYVSVSEYGMKGSIPLSMLERLDGCLSRDELRRRYYPNEERRHLSPSQDAILLEDISIGGRRLFIGDRLTDEDKAILIGEKREVLWKESSDPFIWSMRNLHAERVLIDDFLIKTGGLGEKDAEEKAGRIMDMGDSKYMAWIGRFLQARLHISPSSSPAEAAYELIERLSIPGFSTGAFKGGERERERARLMDPRSALGRIFREERARDESLSPLYLYNAELKSLVRSLFRQTESSKKAIKDEDAERMLKKALSATFRRMKTMCPLVQDEAPEAETGESLYIDDDRITAEESLEIEKEANGESKGENGEKKALCGVPILICYISALETDKGGSNFEDSREASPQLRDTAYLRELRERYLGPFEMIDASRLEKIDPGLVETKVIEGKTERGEGLDRRIKSIVGDDGSIDAEKTITLSDSVLGLSRPRAGARAKDTSDRMEDLREWRADKSESYIRFNPESGRTEYRIVLKSLSHGIENGSKIILPGEKGVARIPVIPNGEAMAYIRGSDGNLVSVDIIASSSTSNSLAPIHRIGDVKEAELDDGYFERKALSTIEGKFEKTERKEGLDLIASDGKTVIARGVAASFALLETSEKHMGERGEILKSPNSSFEADGSATGNKAGRMEMGALAGDILIDSEISGAVEALKRSIDPIKANGDMKKRAEDILLSYGIRIAKDDEEGSVKEKTPSILKTLRGNPLFDIA